MTAVRNTPVLVTLVEEASSVRPVTVPTERQPSRAAATARTATVPATATVRRGRCPCLETEQQHLPVRFPTAAALVVAAAAAECPVPVGSATTAAPSSRHRTPSSVANVAWRVTRDVTSAHPALWTKTMLSQTLIDCM